MYPEKSSLCYYHHKKSKRSPVWKLWLPWHWGECGCFKPLRSGHHSHRPAIAHLWVGERKSRCSWVTSYSTLQKSMSPCYFLGQLAGAEALGSTLGDNTGHIKEGERGWNLQGKNGTCRWTKGTKSTVLLSFMNKPHFLICLIFSGQIATLQRRGYTRHHTNITFSFCLILIHFILFKTMICGLL